MFFTVGELTRKKKAHSVIHHKILEAKGSFYNSQFSRNLPRELFCYHLCFVNSENKGICSHGAGVLGACFFATHF